MRLVLKSIVVLHEPIGERPQRDRDSDKKQRYQRGEYRKAWEKYAERGTMIGMILGIFFFAPWGMIVFSFAGAFLAEIIFAKKQSSEALKSAFGSFLGFLAGTGIKLIACGIMMYYIIVYL